MNYSKLHQYQKNIVNFLWTHPYAVLSVDMGLGKTLSCLVFLSFLLERNKGREKGTLHGIIVAPKRVAENNWMQEAEKFGFSELVNLMTIAKGTKKQRLESLNDTSRPIKVISRDNVKDLHDSGLGSYPNDFLILDELTSFKSTTSARTKAVCDINADRKIGLTGTFLANGAIDIYGQMLAIGITINKMNFYAWRATYFRDALQGSGLQFQKWVMRGTLEDVLQPIKDNIFTLTAADWLDIPKVVEITHAIELNRSQKKEYDNLQAFLACKIGDEVVSFDEGQKFSKLQTLCDGFVYVQDEDTEERQTIRADYSDKLQAVADLCEVMHERGERVLLFYSFIEERKWLVELLTAKGLIVADAKDKDFIRTWNEGKCDILTAHPASAGHGLNLQYGGRVIVWSSLTYNYELFAQANARLARQGQTRQTLIHYFVAKDTVEEQMVRALTKKQREQNQFTTITK